MNQNDPCLHCSDLARSNERLLLALENAQRVQAESLLRAFGIQSEERERIYATQEARASEYARREAAVARVLSDCGVVRQDDGRYLDTLRGVVYDSVEDAINDLSPGASVAPDDREMLKPPGLNGGNS